MGMVPKPCVPHRSERGTGQAADSCFSSSPPRFPGRARERSVKHFLLEEKMTLLWRGARRLTQGRKTALTR